jgi:putative FmdB family regulatory protein
MIQYSGPARTGGRETDMPIYEYRCEACGRTSSFLLLRISEEVDPFCKTCGSKDVARIISRVAVLKSEEQRMESLLDPSKFSDLDENDPASVERVMKRMGRELGDELGEGFEESMEEAMAEESGGRTEESE